MAILDFFLHKKHKVLRWVTYFFIGIGFFIGSFIFTLYLIKKKAFAEDYSGIITEKKIILTNRNAKLISVGGYQYYVDDNIFEFVKVGDSVIKSESDTAYIFIVYRMDSDSVLQQKIFIEQFDFFAYPRPARK